MTALIPLMVLLAASCDGLLGYVREDFISRNLVRRILIKGCLMVMV